MIHLFCAVRIAAQILCLLLILCILMVLFSGQVIEVSGIENYDKAVCSLGTTRYLFPGDDFLTEFPYEDSGFHFYDPDTWATDKGSINTIAYLRYSPEVYEEAKTFCLETFPFCEDHQFAYNGYQFAEHICFSGSQKDENGWIAECFYPDRFCMFAYNDEESTLVFLGYYSYANKSEELDLAETDFGAFVETVYAKYFEVSQ